MHTEEHTPAEVEKLNDAQEVGYVQGRGAHDSGFDLTKLSDVAVAVGMEPEVNASQFRALCHCPHYYPTLVHGPPGTGKTTFAVALLKTFTDVGAGHCLACSPSNTGVDNLCSLANLPARESRHKAGVQ